MKMNTEIKNFMQDFKIAKVEESLYNNKGDDKSLYYEQRARAAAQQRLLNEPDYNREQTADTLSEYLAIELNYARLSEDERTFLYSLYYTFQDYIASVAY